jgi:asparagine synthase (glutamine-hydrolysing)
LKIAAGEAAPKPVEYWNLRNVWLEAANKPLTLSAQDQHHYLRSVLKDSIKHHFIADVPVGIFLSSGLDSTTLTALAAEDNTAIKTLTLGFTEYQNSTNDETILAHKVAEQYKTEQQTKWVSKNDFQDNLGQVLAAMDQPSIDGVNTFFVCKAAAEAGLKVALSGVGADELLGGYASFQAIPQMVQKSQKIRKIPFSKPVFKHLVFPIVKNRLPPKAKYALNYTDSIASTYFFNRCLALPEQIKGFVTPTVFKQGMEELATLQRLNASVKDLPNAHSQISFLEMNWYMRNQLLRDTDWASMAHSLEVRTPFVDIEVIQKIAPLYTGSNQPSKKDMAVTPSVKLPDGIINKPKTGFSIPVAQWLIGETTAKQGVGYKDWAKFLGEQFGINA